jgi:hypothetical protein
MRFPYYFLERTVMFYFISNFFLIFIRDTGFYIIFWRTLSTRIKLNLWNPGPPLVMGLILLWRQLSCYNTVFVLELVVRQSSLGKFAMSVKFFARLSFFFATFIRLILLLLQLAKSHLYLWMPPENFFRSLLFHSFLIFPNESCTFLNTLVTVCLKLFLVV